MRDPADRDHVAILREFVDEGHARVDLDSRGRTIRADRAGVRRDDVPQKDVVLYSELSEDAVDDRRRRFRGTGSRELAFRRERDAGDASTAIAGRFPDEEDRRSGALLQVRGEPPAEQLGPRAFGVLVERPTDPRRGELVHECLGRYDAASVTGSSGKPG